VQYNQIPFIYVNRHERYTASINRPSHSATKPTEPKSLKSDKSMLLTQAGLQSTPPQFAHY